MLHFIWVGAPLPHNLASNVNKWARMHESWSIQVWTERDLGWLRNLPLFKDARSIVPADAVEQFQADIARYEILLRHGGFYADVDTVPVKPIDHSVLKHPEFAVQEDPTWIGNTYLGAKKNHPLMEAIVSGLAGSARRNRGRRPNVIAGPKYITPLWQRYEGHVAPTSWGFPYSYTDVKRGTIPTEMPNETYAVHEWHHTKRLMEKRNARR